MNQRQSKSQSRWTDVKAKLTGFDRLALLGLIQDLYSAHKDNQTFLHARFGLGEHLLRPYKETIDRWLWPDAFSRQAPSVLKAKQAISNYKKAVGEPAGLAELMVFYCEQASGFASDLGYQNESYLNALVRMFDQALIVAMTLPASGRDALVARLERFAPPATSAVMASETIWTPSWPSMPSAWAVRPCASNLDSGSDTSLHASLPETH